MGFKLGWEHVFISLGYPGILLISFIGASSIVLPIPYPAALLIAGGLDYFNHILLAVFAALGAALGELIGYIAGYAGRSLVSGEREKQFDAMIRIFNRYGAPAIFVFALTPLPDDLLFIPLGLARYNFWKAFLPCVAGKFLMSLIIVKFGAFIGYFTGGGWLTALLTAILLVIVLYSVFRVDWTKIANKIAPKKEEESSN